MPAYARFAACDLPKAVGVDTANGRRRSDGRAGHICHGPYITLGPGRYTAGFYLHRRPGGNDGEVTIDVSVDHGARILAGRTAPVRELFSSVDGLLSVDFAVDAVERSCELRLHVSPRAEVELAEVVLFRTDLASWGVR